jgi:hypothetical protein
MTKTGHSARIDRLPDTVGGSTAKPPSWKSKPTAPMFEGRRDLIVDDVVDFKLAGVDVAQQQVGRACCV